MNDLSQQELRKLLKALTGIISHLSHAYDDLDRLGRSLPLNFQPGFPWSSINHDIFAAHLKLRDLYDPIEKALTPPGP